ncbi:MAG TPA: hypothetical protein VFN67_04290 [Polyangiales bacterium]|nr:hypothetical protein [Polyangiales bacterium]
MSKLQDYLKQQKIDPRRLLAASHKLEASRPEDRVTRLAKKKAKGGDESAKEAAAKKPQRSGKPLSGPTLDRALSAESSSAVSGAAKTRILRALNSVLATKKQPEVTLKDLF